MSELMAGVQGRHIGLENPIANEKYLMYRSALRFSVIRAKNSTKNMFVDMFVDMFVGELSLARPSLCY